MKKESNKKWKQGHVTKDDYKGKAQAYWENI